MLRVLTTLSWTMCTYGCCPVVGVFIWLIVEFARYLRAGGQECEFPITTWCIVYLATCNYALKLCSFCAPQLLCAVLEPGNIVAPLRVNVASFLVLSYHCGLNALGVYYSYAAGSGVPAQCAQVCPALLLAMQYNSGFGVVISCLSAAVMLVIICYQASFQFLIRQS